MRVLHFLFVSRDLERCTLVGQRAVNDESEGRKYEEMSMVIEGLKEKEYSKSEIPF